MINPFSEIDWNPDRTEVKSFGKKLLVSGLIVVPVALGTYFAFDNEKLRHSALFLSRLFGACSLLGFASFLAPGLGRQIYRGWHFLAASIGFVLTNVLLSLFFFGFFTPLALIMRYVVRRDVLVLKRPEASSTWVVHRPPSRVSRYFRQY